MRVGCVTPSMSSQPRDKELSDLVARCILVHERDGDTAVTQVLAAAGELGVPAREQLEALRLAGLLVPPERPSQIGPYRVLERLGIGGMGSVWLCEQETPVRRLVAVKLIRPGMDSSELLARFAIERQALALLSHPNVAKVIDAGATRDGRPFLVMEYVAGGVGITRFCDERRLGLKARLQLFTKVCDAVQHAHQKGILHRDLKPTNILVTEAGGAPFPVVIDFGVAKSLTGLVPGATVLTMPGHLLGTPEYMSPEQAQSEQDVDTRTDVYSLGAILYELLVGVLPLPDHLLRSPAEMARALRDVEPTAPSSRLASLGDAAATIATARGTDPATLRRRLRGDLDWIVLKALEKDRNRRYGMPADLAEDLRRHQRAEPVSAARPSTSYRFAKYWARHRVQVSAACLVLLALTGGLTASLSFYREAAAAERTASATADRLHASLDTALAAVDQIVVLGAEGLRELPHSGAVRADLLRSALEWNERLLAAGTDADARLPAALALTLARTAQLRYLLGDSAEAAKFVGRADEILARLPAPDAHTLPSLRALARAHLLLGELEDLIGDPARARVHDVAALAAFARWTTLAPAEREARFGRMQAQRGAADRLTGHSPAGARALFAEALPAARASVDDPAADHGEQVEAVRVMVRACWLATETNAPETADLLRESRAATQRVMERCTTLVARLDCVPILRQFISVHGRTGDWQQAGEDMEVLVALLRQAMRELPDAPHWQGQLARTLFLQARIGEERRSPVETDRLEREALAMETDYWERTGRLPDASHRLVGTLVDYGARRIDWLEEGGANAASVDLEFVRQTSERAEAIHAVLPPALQRDRRCRELWAQSFRVRAELARRAGDVVAARNECDAGDRFLQALADEHPGVAQCKLLLGEHLLRSAGFHRDPADVERWIELGRRGLSALLEARGPDAEPGPLWRRIAHFVQQWLVQAGEVAARRQGPAAGFVDLAVLVARCAALADAAGEGADAQVAARVGTELLAAAVAAGFQDVDRLRHGPEFARLRGEVGGPPSARR